MRIKSQGNTHVSQVREESIWPQRLSHCRDAVLHNSVPQVYGLKVKDMKRVRERDSCKLRKSVRVPRKSISFEDTSSAKPLEHIHKDVVGPMNNNSLGKASYFATLLDSYSEFSLVHFLHRKSVAGHADISMIREMKGLSD